MGSSGSKAVRTGANAAPRKYPTRTPPSGVTQAANAASRPPPPEAEASAPGPTVHPAPEASDMKTQTVNLDASDPVYASHLHTMGIVQPKHFLSNSSTAPSGPPAVPSSRPGPPQASSRRPQEPFDAIGQPFPVSPFPDPRTNPAIAILEARQRLQEEAEREFRTPGAARQFLDMGIIRQILMLRDVRGMSGGEIEKRLELKKGVVAKLGPKGMFDGL